MVCNASGLGFNGYDENNEPKWDLLSNVDIFNIEVGFFLNYIKEESAIVAIRGLRHTSSCFSYTLIFREFW